MLYLDETDTFYDSHVCRPGRRIPNISIHNQTGHSSPIRMARLRCTTNRRGQSWTGEIEKFLYCCSQSWCCCRVQARRGGGLVWLQWFSDCIILFVPIQNRITFVENQSLERVFMFLSVCAWANEMGRNRSGRPPQQRRVAMSEETKAVHPQHRPTVHLNQDETRKITTVSDATDQLTHQSITTASVILHSIGIVHFAASNFISLIRTIRMDNQRIRVDWFISDRVSWSQVWSIEASNRRQKLFI